MRLEEALELAPFARRPYYLNPDKYIVVNRSFFSPSGYEYTINWADTMRELGGMRGFDDNLTAGKTDWEPWNPERTAKYRIIFVLSPRLQRQEPLRAKIVGRVPIDSRDDLGRLWGDAKPKD